MIAINSIISAIGNNNSIYPLLVRDCGIEVPTKVFKTYKQNKDDKEIAYLATRERLIDEYSTSAVWLGGIPLINTVFGKIIKFCGYSPVVNIKLIQAEEKLNEIDKKLKNCSPSEQDKLLSQREIIYQQSLSGNIEKFSKVKGAEKAVEDLKKVKLNQNTYKKLLAGKFATEMILPIAFMGFIIPKAVYAITASTRKRMEEKQKTLNSNNIKFEGVNFEKFKKQSSSYISFNGNLSSYLCNMNTVQKMAATDGGYAVGRVTTARKKRGAIDIAFRMLGMLYLNFVAPKQIEKILSGISKQLFDIDVNLDPIILGDREFIEQIKNKSIILPKSSNIKDIIEFIDNPENSKSLYVKYAQKLKKIQMLNDTTRDPRAYLNEKSLGTLRDNMDNFIKSVQKLSKNKMTPQTAKRISKFAAKAKFAKTFNILSNVAISSYLLACVLPDAQYLFREKVLGTKLEPDLL